MLTGHGSPVSPTLPTGWHDDGGVARGWIGSTPAQALHSQEHWGNWSFASTTTAEGHHAIGLEDYSLRLAPFDARVGDLLSAQMRFRATMTFEGTIAAAAAAGELTRLGTAGAFSGGAWFGYWDSRNLYPPVGRPFRAAGAGKGVGSREASAGKVRWTFSVDEAQNFTSNFEGAAFGFSTASYEQAKTRLCTQDACQGMYYGLMPHYREPFGICGRACSKATAVELQQLSWRRPDLWKSSLRTVASRPRDPGTTPCLTLFSHSRARLPLRRASCSGVHANHPCWLRTRHAHMVCTCAGCTLALLAEYSLSVTCMVVRSCCVSLSPLVCHPCTAHSPSAGLLQATSPM